VKEMKKSIILLSILLLLPLIQAHTVTLKLYTDLQKTQVYSNEFLWAYLQNKTFVGGELSYNVSCFNAKYTGGQALITVPTGYYDVLFVDGAISWNNNTNCPDRADNYDIWATAQSNVLIDGDKTLDYFVNTTLIAPPRQYFWNVLSFRTIISIIVWILIGALCFVVAWKTNSGLAVAIIFLICLFIKLGLGI
jgi:hypothetical protein